MKLVIVSGSHRQNAQSERIGAVLADRAVKHHWFDSTDILSLAANPLPLWEASIYSGNEHWQELLAPWKQTLKTADALVIVTPEWNGMVPAALKNFFLLFGAAVLGHKPGLITAVSAGAGGSYPVAELRMSSYKNCRLCYLPEHLIIRQVASALTGEDPEGDQWLLKRIDYSLALLREYAIGLAGVRRSGVIDHKSFANGM